MLGCYRGSRSKPATTKPRLVRKMTKHGATAPLRVAVDCSLLSGSNGGLGRYLRALLPRMMASAEAGVEWLLYARSATVCTSLPLGRQLRLDRLPAHLGRILAPAFSLPFWTRRDQPQVFWAPAHRLPVWLPVHTAGVVTIHDLAWARVPATLRYTTRFLDRTLMGRSVQRAQRLIAVSNATAADIAAHWPGNEIRTRVIHGSAEILPPPGPLAAYAPALRPHRYLLFVGTLEPRKNLPRLLQGYATACRVAADFPALVIAGGHGWGGEHLRRMIARQRLTDRVQLMGVVSDAALSTLYAHALCLVMPSLHEGFGLPIVEAMRYGLPVLTSSTSSMPEVAGKAGLLVDPQSTASIAAGLQRIVQDAPLRGKLASAARTQAALYSWDRAAEETLEVLREAATTRGTPPRN